MCPGRGSTESVIFVKRRRKRAGSAGESLIPKEEVACYVSSLEQLTYCDAILRVLNDAVLRGQ